MGLKFLFGFVLIALLVQSGKLDFSLAQRVFSAPGLWILALLVMIFQTCLSSLRWRILLQTGTRAELPYFDILKYNWIGMFFNTFLPGAVSGDFVKLIYVKKNDPQISKSFLIISVFMDRILGVVGLVSLMGIMSLFYYQEVTQLSPVLKQMIHFNIALLVGALGFILALFLPLKWQEKIVYLLEKIPLLGGFMSRILQQTWQIGADRWTIFKALFLSFAIQFASVLAFWLLTSSFYSNPISLGLSFTFIPLGFMALSIPIAPAGLGVGHMVFEGLLGYAGITGGANLFNLHFLMGVFINSFGIIPYLMNGRVKVLDTDLSKT